MTKQFQEAMSYDDVLLVPQRSLIKSRKDINLDSSLGDTKLDIPIVASPMDTVTGPAMAAAIAGRGGMAVLHRYNTIHEQATMLKEYKFYAHRYHEVEEPLNYVAAAIGMNGDAVERAKKLISMGVKYICIDVAHGHHKMMKDTLKTLRDRYDDSIHIIAGNVATKEGFEDLAKWGANTIRVGVGSGSICSTRIQTGHGLPVFQSILDCAESNASHTVNIIADGGIRNAGDICKALAAGANFVMVGSLFAGTSESPGEIVMTPGGKAKTYRGMASKEAQNAWKGTHNSIEGISTTVPYRGPVDEVINELIVGIKSGLSYSGAINLDTFRTKARFVRQTTGGQRESDTHILNRQS